MSGKTNADAALRRLDKLVGTWTVSGGATGTITYEWMNDHFMIQHVDIDQAGHHVKGMEVIGRLLSFGAEKPGDEIMSRFYGSDGETFDYVYEIGEDGDTLTIWGGERDSPAYFRGIFKEDDTVNDGRWFWPGGGYDSVMTKAG
jgi:hypothetical protein